jgi:hypothetical protein
MNPSAIEVRHDMNVMGRITQHILNDLRWAGLREPAHTLLRLVPIIGKDYTYRVDREQ